MKPAQSLLSTPLPPKALEGAASSWPRLALTLAVAWLALGLQASHAADVTIPMKASMVLKSGGGWAPNHLSVHQGDHVTLKITSADMGHSLVIPAFNVDSGIIGGGKSKTVSFVATKAGTFEFHCNTVCGGGHSKMVGTLTVSP